MIKIVGALIEKDGFFLIAQRKYGDTGETWEFPGGKIEANETEEQALKREIKEEIEIEIDIIKFIDTKRYDYPTRTIEMNLYLCKYLSGRIKLNEHKNIDWIKPLDLDIYNLCPLDRLFIESINKSIL
jgi:8-oxo-dGTP diphosphatase